MGQKQKIPGASAVWLACESGCCHRVLVGGGHRPVRLPVEIFQELEPSRERETPDSGRLCYCLIIPVIRTPPLKKALVASQTPDRMQALKTLVHIWSDPMGRRVRLYEMHRPS